MNGSSDSFLGIWIIVSAGIATLVYLLTRNAGTAVKWFLLSYVLGIVIFRFVRYGERLHRDAEDDKRDEDKNGED